MKKASGGFSLKGKYRIITTDSRTGEVKRSSQWIKNLIMLANDLGVNLLLRRLANDLTYDVVVTSAEIGTGNATPTNSDNALATPVLTGISIAQTNISVNNIVLSVFIPNGSLANNTYKEFALRCGTQMFARSLILPVYVKGSNEDTTIEYTITGSNS